MTNIERLVGGSDRVKRAERRRSVEERRDSSSSRTATGGQEEQRALTRRMKDDLQPDLTEAVSQHLHTTQNRLTSSYDQDHDDNWADKRARSEMRNEER